MKDLTIVKIIMFLLGGWNVGQNGGIKWLRFEHLHKSVLGAQYDHSPWLNPLNRCH